MVRFFRRLGLAASAVSLCLGAPSVRSAPDAAVPGTAETARTAGAAAVVLSGATLDAMGRAISGVTVRLQTTDPESGRVKLRSVMSDAEGRFAIEGLVPGLYRVIAVKGGYAVLVAQVNTMLETAIDLVLRPSGAPETPGARPDDGRWSLRLPARDPLEDHGPALDPAGAATDSQWAGSGSVPVQLELRAQSGSGSDGADGQRSSSVGLSAAVETAFVLGNAGHLGVAYDHRNEGAPDLDVDREDRILATFMPDPKTGPFPIRVGLEIARETHDRAGLADGAELLNVESESVAISAGWRRDRADRSIETFLEAVTVEGVQETPGGTQQTLSVAGRDHEAYRYRAGFETVRRTDGGGRVVYRGLAGGAPKGSWTAPQQAESSVPRSLLPRGEDAALGALADAYVDAGVEFGWTSRRTRSRMSIAGRAEHATVGDAAALRWAGGLVATWRLPRGIELELGSGIATRATAADEVTWSAGLAQHGERLAWAITRSHGTGLDPWVGGSLSAAPALVTDRDGEIDRWAFSATWAAHPNGLRVALDSAHYEMLGRLATSIAGDLPWVPVAAHGAAAGQRIGLSVLHPRTGTSVGFAWSTLEDETGDGILLGGAATYTSQRLDVRQKIGVLDWQGAVWQVVLGIEEARLEEVGSKGASSRVALLDNRRVSGGLMLAF